MEFLKDFCLSRFESFSFSEYKKVKMNLHQIQDIYRIFLFKCIIG